MNDRPCCQPIRLRDDDRTATWNPGTDSGRATWLSSGADEDGDDGGTVGR